MSDESWAHVRRIALFAIGALVVLGEVFTGDDHVRPLVIGLGLVLMGMVTIDQIVAWIGRGATIDGTARRADGTPEMKPEWPRKPEAPE